MARRIYRWTPFDVRVSMKGEDGENFAPGIEKLNKFGRNLDVDTSAAEDIWSGGGVYTWPTTAQLVDVVSDNAADSAAGAGAATVEIFGLDASYEQISETIVLAGLTPVRSVNEYLRGFRAICRDPGSTSSNRQTNVGTITAVGVVDTPAVMIQIEPATGQTVMALWTVPLGKRFVATRLYGSLGRQQAAACSLALYARPFGECWQIKQILDAHSHGTSEVQVHFPEGLDDFDEKTDLVVSAVVSGNNADVNAGFEGIFYDRARFEIGN